MPTYIVWFGGLNRPGSMGYRSLRDCVQDLEQTGQLVRIREEVDPHLEMAEIHRRIYDRKGPAILFERVKGSPFQALSNLYGTNARAEYLFRDTLEHVARVVALKADPSLFFKRFWYYKRAPLTAWRALPWRRSSAQPKYGSTRIDLLPQIVSWPKDGGAFITLPQVLSMPPGSRDIMQSNLGMYRIQLSGNDYEPNREVGLHYQLHRGIGVHHTAYLRSDDPFRVSIFVGGPPSHALAAIFPLPEGLSELTFAGMLGNRRFRYHLDGGYAISNDADFVITGTIVKNVEKREGPFGDHLGYYSLDHDFPVMRVENVYHRRDPLWHFTVVGRPPQEDSGFGHLIHRLVGPILAQEFPGVKQINAVDVAGVHPLLLAVGSERYMPFREPRPEEILTQANHLLGSGQTSLAKYLVIAADDPPQTPDVRSEAAFLGYVLQRVDWRRDLHFQTETTIDTLDYSGSGWNAGSKVVIACHGPKLRELASVPPAELRGVAQTKVVSPGILAVESATGKNQGLQALCDLWAGVDLAGFPLIVIVDDADFVARRYDNFLWVTFTRSDPARDISGLGSFTKDKHWGCIGSLVIDARIKEHHAPILEVDQEVARRVDRLFAKGGSLQSLDR